MNHKLKNIKVLSTPCLNHLSANPTKWANTPKQFVGKLPTNCLCLTIVWDWRLNGLLIVLKQCKRIIENNANNNYRKIGAKRVKMGPKIILLSFSQNLFLSDLSEFMF